MSTPPRARAPLVRYARGAGWGAIGLYLAFVGALFVGQRSLVFPRGEPMPSEAVPGFEVTDVTFPGGTVPLLVHDAAAPGLVWFHGNATQLGQRTDIVRAFAQDGLAVAAAEFPGYGHATGVGPSESALFDAARATLDALAARGWRRPTCAAHSLGTGVAAAMAAEGRCARLVLVSPYTSVAAAAQAAWPFVPARWLVRDRFDTAALAPRLALPTLVIHGTHDEVIPYAMGEALGAAIPGARFVSRDAGHNDILDWDVLSLIATFAAASPG